MKTSVFDNFNDVETTIHGPFNTRAEADSFVSGFYEAAELATSIDDIKDTDISEVPVGSPDNISGADNATLAKQQPRFHEVSVLVTGVRTAIFRAASPQEALSVVEKAHKEEDYSVLGRFELLDNSFETRWESAQVEQSADDPDDL